MRLAVLTVPLLLGAAQAPDKTPTTCDLVGNYAWRVAEEREEFVPEEEAGKIKGVSKASLPKLREIVHMVYANGLSPQSSQFFAWRICMDTAEETKR